MQSGFGLLDFNWQTQTHLSFRTPNFLVNILDRKVQADYFTVDQQLGNTEEIYQLPIEGRKSTMMNLIVTSIPLSSSSKATNSQSGETDTHEKWALIIAHLKVWNLVQTTPELARPRKLQGFGLETLLSTRYHGIAGSSFALAGTLWRTRHWCPHKIQGE